VPPGGRNGRWFIKICVILPKVAAVADSLTDFLQWSILFESKEGSTEKVNTMAFSANIGKTLIDLFSGAIYNLPYCKRYSCSFEINWIPNSGFRIPDSGFRFRILDSGFDESAWFFKSGIVFINLMSLKQRNDTQPNDIQLNDIQHKDIEHNDTQHNDNQYNNIQHNDLQHDDIWHNNIQHNDTQHYDIQHYATLHNDTQHNDNQHNET
jgi:hypothetical protein